MGSFTHDEKKQTHFIQKQLATTKHENSKNIAFSRQLTEQTQIEKKGKKKIIYTIGRRCEVKHDAQ